MDSNTADLVIRYRDKIIVVRVKSANLTNILDVGRMSRDLTALIEAGNIRMVLDLKNVRYVGSAALGMLLEVANHMRQAGGKLVLSHPEHIRELLRVSKTDRLFTLADTPKDAMALLAE